MMARPRVLVLEEGPELRRLIRSCLALFGFEVASTAHGLPALDLLRRRPFDAIVSDRDEIVHDLRMSGDPTPVLVIRAKLEDAVFDNVGFLEKPFDLDALKSALDALLGEAPPHHDARPGMHDCIPSW